jgi:fumarate hydratase class II
MKQSQPQAHHLTQWLENVGCLVARAVCLQAIRNDTPICFAEAFGSMLDLNVTKPLITVNMLRSIELLANGICSFVQNCLKGLKANLKSINLQLERNLMIVTRLVLILGYDKASEIARLAAERGKTIKQVVMELKFKIKGNLDELLDPTKMV